MKKSDIYRQAQIAVLDTCHVTAATKLDILRELMSREDTEKFLERREEEVSQ